jgi:choice-of-anchor B domain-containing protein
MKKIIFAIFLLYSGALKAQLPNHNTHLIGQLDNYKSYSGLWGYLSDNGREYAVLGCYNGTSVIDVTDSANIREIGFIPGVNSNWREVKTYSHYAYVVSEGTNSKLQIIDLQYLPDSVHLVTSWNYSGYTVAHNISQSGPYLYLSGGNACANGGVQIIDITNPVSPVKRGNNTLRYVHDVRVVNDTLWATNINNQKISIINAVNKDTAREIKNFNTLQSLPHNCAVSKNRNYLFVTYENQDPGMLDIWNIQDQENITYVRSWQPTGIATSVTHNIEIYGDTAVIAHYTAGIRVLDISNPANPVEVAWYDTRPQDNTNSYLGCWAVYKFPSGKIIGSDITNGLFVIKMDFPVEISSNEKLTEGFTLGQNYPNPYNPSTKISFSIPENGFVVLSVYSSSGKLISEIVNEYRISGNYISEFNASDLPSGVYFYKMKYYHGTMINELNRKMIVLK